MTATTGSGTDPHPEVAEISDLTEGLLPPGRGAAVRSHLDDCSLCADVRDSLEEIRGLLGTLPGPQRMPADVAGRIDAALAAEAHLDTVLPGPRVPRGTSPTAHVPRETSAVPLLAGRRRHWRTGLLTAASVAGVVLLGGAVYATVSNGGGGAATDSSAGSEKRAVASAPATDPVADQVRQLLAGPASGGGVSGKSADSPMLNASGGATPAPPAVPSCVLQATHDSQRPLAAQRDLYQGTDSYLVVLPHPGDESRVDAYVVNASCTATDPGTVLFRSTYPR